MEDVFKIYVEQLRKGNEEKIHETIHPSSLEIDESDLLFDKSIELKGVAYLAEQELVFHWDIHTEVLLPCSICNELVKTPINIENFYASEPVPEMKSGVYNFKNLLRETILLEIPFFVECNEGNCLKRKEYGKYLKKTSASSTDEEGYHPFADL